MERNRGSRPSGQRLRSTGKQRLGNSGWSASGFEKKLLRGPSKDGYCEKYKLEADFRRTTTPILCETGRNGSSEDLTSKQMQDGRSSKVNEALLHESRLPGAKTIESRV